MKSFWGSILFFAGCCVCLNAQPSYSEKTVQSFFSKPKKIQWLHHYKGRIDGANDIAVTLAYDGKSCKGLLIYLKSGEQFRLDGLLNGNDLILLEVDQSGAITGNFEGYIEGKNIQFSWSNFDNTIGSDVSLTQVSKEELSPTSCGNDNWICVYNGIIFGSKAEFILQKNNPDELRGIAYFEAEDKSYHLKGEITDHNSLNITFRDDNHLLKGTLEGVFTSENAISANFFSISGMRSPTILINEKHLEIDCLEYADYVASYNIIFPKIPNAGFNRWMDELTDAWVEEFKEHSFEVRSVNTATNPETRASIRANAWCDIELYNEHFISGMLTFENTWKNGLEGKSFNFDLKKGKEISLDDIFPEGFDHTGLVINLLNKEIEKHVLYKNYEFRKWMSVQEFPYFVIHKDGLAFYTDFSSIYGRQTVKIPYETLKPYLKEDTVLPAWAMNNEH